MHGPIHYQITVQESTTKYQEDPIQYIIQSVHGLIHYKITMQESTAVKFIINLKLIMWLHVHNLIWIANILYFPWILLILKFNWTSLVSISRSWIPCCNYWGWDSGKIKIKIIDKLTWKKGPKKKKTINDWSWPNCKSTHGLGIHLPIGILNTKVYTRPWANPNFNLPSVSPHFSLTPNLWPILKKFIALIFSVFFYLTMVSIFKRI